MSKLLANQISNYNDNGPVEVKDGVNIPTGKPLQVAGGAGTSGQFLKSTGSSVDWEDFPSIPAAQVNADWSAGTGVAQIINKPNLSTVAVTGSYDDLSNKPSIPSAQIQSDWNQTQVGYADYIKNKPTIFSGNYTDLSGKPTIPATVSDLSDVNIPSPGDGEYIKWDQSTLRWVAGSGSAGLSNISEDTTPQLGGPLFTQGFNINTGTNFIDNVKVGQWDTAYSWGNHTQQGYLTTDTNTEYSQSSIQDGGNVKLRLSGTNNTNDDIVVTAGTGITFTNITAAGFQIDSSGGGGGSGASVTVDDNAPSSPTGGDLWWKSDEARLKVYYTDTDGSQWVDASPPLASTTIGGTATGGNSISVTNTATEVTGTLITDNISWGGHMLPSANDTFDIGSADYKVRDLYVSDSTIHMGDSATIKSEGSAIVVQDLKTGDLHLDNTTRTFMGHQVGNDIDGTSGSWTFQEGSADLYLLNNMSGKRYKINLTEV